MSQGTATKSKNTNQGKVGTPESSSPSQSARETRQSKRRVTAEANQQEDHQVSYEEARAHLAEKGLLPLSTPCIPQTLAMALKQLATSPTLKTLPSIQKTISSLGEVASNLTTHCLGCTRSADLPDLLKEACQNIQADVQRKMEELDRTITGKLASQEGISRAVEKIEDTAKNLDKIAAEVSDKVTMVSDSTTHLANTAHSYRDALLRNPTPGPGRGQGQVTEAEISLAADKKERQVLIEMEEAQLSSHSNEALLGKAEHAISQLIEPPPPEDMTITQVSKVRKNGLLISFKEKAAAQWLRRPEVGPKFTEQFIEGSLVKQRQFPLLVPRIPLTFSPGDTEQLREIEEGNGLERNTIDKARWIKPIYRRVLGQKAAHATFLINDATMANKCIKEGLFIRGAKVYPTRLKQEPTQCMKCRGWGHYASDCSATKDTCGTCGGEHRSADCMESGKRYCASCKSNAHASWDRSCPEFLKRCAWYDEKHPDNTLKYFPTEEAWSQEVRPARFPFAERFPMQYAVGSLPPQSQGGRGFPTRLIEKKSKNHKHKGKGKGKGKGKLAAGQTTIDGFFPGSQNQERAESEDEEAEDRDEPEVFHDNEQSVFAESASAGSAEC